MTINATSTIKILRLFYDRINSDRDFYTGVMGSISGLMSSPMAAVYAASKASVCRLIESVNIELEVSGIANRILNVSPASFKGSDFYGGPNRLELMKDLAENITERIFTRETLYIPQYEETFKAVLERYHADPHEYGIYSYEFKKDSGRVNDSSRIGTGYLSGCFDPFDIRSLERI
jgi:short-subunit dehydrogenase